MTRSLRNWLASLFLLAAPSVAFGQNYVGQPHLAPVALEARCRVADGMLDSWPNFHVTGADPLRVAMLSLKQNRSTPVFDAGCGAASVPACYAEDASTELAASAQPKSVPTKELVADTSEAAIEVKAFENSESPIANFQPSPDFCPFADYVQARSIHSNTSINASQIAAKPASKELLAEIAAGEPIDVNYLEAVNGQVADDCAEAMLLPGSSTVGSGPMVVTLDEEYLPYDLNEVDSDRQHPITIRILNLRAPNYCMLPNNAVMPTQLEDDAVLVVDTDFNIQPQPCRFPLDCWMDELVWRTSDLFDASGPVVQQLDAGRLGGRIAQMTAVTLDGVVEYSQPVVQILAQRVLPKQPAGQQFAMPAGQHGGELAAAGSALISVAEDLESLAAALRGWGNSINRVAVAGRPMNR